MKPHRTFLCSTLCLALLANPCSATRIKGKIYDSTIDMKPLSGVRVTTKLPGGELVKAQTATDGGYVLEVPPNTQLVVTYGGGVFLTTDWPVTTKGPTDEHLHDEFVIRQQAVALVYWKEVGQTLATQASGQLTRTWESLSANQVPATMKVAIAASLLKARPDAFLTIPELAQFGHEDPEQILTLAKEFSTAVKSRQTVPSRDEIVAKNITVPNSVTVAELVAENAATKAPGERDAIFRDVEKLWNKSTREKAEKATEARDRAERFSRSHD